MIVGWRENRIFSTGEHRSGWRIWQHTNRGRVSGIQGNVDLNFFGGTMEDLIASDGGTPPEPPPDPSLEKRVENLERWAQELDAWAREQGYDGIGPRGLTIPEVSLNKKPAAWAGFFGTRGLTWE